MFASTKDPHVPAVHLRPPRNWLNDPNGLVFHDGHYHVFAQYNPHSARHQNMHWAHFRSRDLLSWELMPIALAPSEGGDDDEGVWSGNAVDLGGELRAFYSAKRADRWYQPVASASSYDGGRTFTKQPELLIAAPPDGTRMFRDPYVWTEGQGWHMLVGAALADGRGAALHYTAEDLQQWSYQGLFFARTPEALPDGGSTEQGWECTQYVHFPDGRGALLISAWSPEAGAQGTAAYTGVQRDGHFEAGPPQRLDHGPDFYAPAVLLAPDGRWLMWAWSWEARDEVQVGAPSEWTDETGWAGMLTLPRELTLGSDGALRQQPARELSDLRRERCVDAAGAVSADHPVELGEVSRSFEAAVRLQPGGGLRLITATHATEHLDAAEYLDISREVATGEVVVDRSCASLDPRAKGGRRRLPAGDGPVDLRIVVDHSIVEVFTGAGDALTMRFYPVGDGPWRLAATSVHDQARYAAQVWDLAALEVVDLSGEGP